MSNITSKSLLDNTHPCYNTHKGYFDVKNQSLSSNDTVCYSLRDSEDILYGYILLKDIEHEGYILKDFPFIKLKNGSLLQSTGRNCLKTH